MNAIYISVTWNWGSCCPEGCVTKLHHTCWASSKEGCKPLPTKAKPALHFLQLDVLPWRSQHLTSMPAMPQAGASPNSSLLKGNI